MQPCASNPLPPDASEQAERLPPLPAADRKRLLLIDYCIIFDFDIFFRLFSLFQIISLASIFIVAFMLSTPSPARFITTSFRLREAAQRSCQRFVDAAPNHRDF